MHRALQQWNLWLTEAVGKDLLSLEQSILSQYLATFGGRYALLIGAPSQSNLLSVCHAGQALLTTPLTIKQASVSAIETDLSELPIATGSMDLVIMPHILEYTVHPHQLFLEASRIVKPEGYLIVLGFNPYSLWGLRKMISRKISAAPWSTHFLPRERIKKWLRLAEFSLIREDTMLFRPPLSRKTTFERLKFLESVGAKLYKPLGGVYILMAQAKVIPLTPIRLKWKQKLANFQPGILTGSLT
ncbi:MAG: methyltransferase domain-containing protein [Gammaproteobacteria bacterium]|nr:methyltransferase domain-containing protein [Gammaproteobacteria bacterium]